jgi:hypothetical protein
VYGIEDGECEALCDQDGEHELLATLGRGTMNQATAVGKIAPKMMAPTQ